MNEPLDDPLVQFALNAMRAEYAELREWWNDTDYTDE